MFYFLDSILGNFISVLNGRSIPGLGLILIIVLIFILGYFATHIFGAKLFKFGEELIFRIPIIKGIYSSAKQVNDVLFVHKEANEFRKSCLIEYPRKGIWTVGFVTSDAALEIEAKTKQKLINVFVPNTPTPATGFLVLVPAQEVLLLDMKTEDAFKYIISGGVLKPESHFSEVSPKKDH